MRMLPLKDNDQTPATHLIPLSFTAAVRVPDVSWQRALFKDRLVVISFWSVESLWLFEKKSSKKQTKKEPVANRGN